MHYLIGWKMPALDEVGKTNYNWYIDHSDTSIMKCHMVVGADNEQAAIDYIEGRFDNADIGYIYEQVEIDGTKTYNIE